MKSPVSLVADAATGLGETEHHLERAQREANVDPELAMVLVDVDGRGATVVLAEPGFQLARDA